MTLCRFAIYPLTLFALVLFSCQKKDVVGPQGPTGPQGPAGTNSVLKGNIIGGISLYDTSANPIADNSGATISIDHSSPLIQATTAFDGSFILDSVNEGVYSISIQKQGFGTMREFNITNTGTNPPSRTPTFYLTQQMSSNYDLKSLTIDTSGKPNLTFTAILAHPQHALKATLLLYINDSTGVGNGRSKNIYYLFNTQVNDSTLTSSPYALGISSNFPQFLKTNNIYFTAVLDNPLSLTYRDETGNYTAPSAAKPAPEVILNNSQHIY